MRFFCSALAALALVLFVRPASAVDPAIQVNFSNPGLSPSQWTLILHPDGSGHFSSQMGKTPDGGWKQIQTPALDRDIQVGKQFTAHVFEVAQRHTWFRQTCESHLKVAFEGWKTLTYTGPQGQGSCTFNYSKDREIQALGDSLVAVAETILEGARLEVLLQHDPLGLDAETAYLAEAVESGRAQEVCTIRDILERLEQDDTVLERVRKRARSLLARGSR